MEPNAQVQWIHRFLNELGRLPETGTIVDAMQWALRAYLRDPSRPPETAARAFADGRSPDLAEPP